MWAREVQAALAGDVGERGVGLGPAGQDSGRGDGDVGQRGRGEWPGSCSSFRSVAVPVRAGRRFSRVCVCVCLWAQHTQSAQQLLSLLCLH